VKEAGKTVRAAIKSPTQTICLGALMLVGAATVSLFIALMHYLR
jgi:hypothetical protein